MLISAERINKYKITKLMIHITYSKKAASRVKFITDILERHKINFVIMVRNVDTYKALIKILPYHDVVYAKTNLEVEQIVNKYSNIKKILYLTDHAKNIHLYLFSNIKHIFIGTRNSDQLIKYNKSYRAYDEMYLSSQSQVDKFKDFVKDTRHLKFKLIGKPQLKNIFLKTQNKINDFSNILYFTNKNNFRQDILLCSKKLDVHMDVIIERSTNNIKSNLSNLINKENLDIFISDDKTMFERLGMNSDILIVDVPSISVFLLAYNIPIIVYVPKAELINLDLLDIPQKCLYTFSTISELERIYEHIKNKDSLKENRVKMSEYLLGKSYTLDDKFIKYLNEDSID